METEVSEMKIELSLKQCSHHVFSKRDLKETTFFQKTVLKGDQNIDQ